MLFATHLSRTIKAASIKAGVRSLHLEHGLGNPLVNCLRLERVLRGIKRTQGVTKRERLPVTLTVLSRIRTALNFERYDDVLFWAACCTGFFGFLRSGEFTTSTSTFDPRIHLAVDDVLVDGRTNPKVVFLKINVRKRIRFGRVTLFALERRAIPFALSERSYITYMPGEVTRAPCSVTRMDCL